MSYTEIKCIKAFLHFSGGRKLMTQTCFFTLLWPWCSSLWGGRPTWKTFSHRLHQFCSWNHWNSCSRCYLKGWLHFSNFYCIFYFFPTAGLCPCGREHWLQLAAHTCNCTPRSWCWAHNEGAFVAPTSLLKGQSWCLAGYGGPACSRDPRGLTLMKCEP